MTRIQRRSLKKAFTPALSLAAVGAMIAACSPATPSTDNSSSSSTPSVMERSSSSSMLDSEASADSGAAAYQDGTYTANGDYRSPGGDETVGVSVTLQNGVITDATFTPHAERPKSVMMQSAFATGFKAEVVGKSIDEVSLDVVNGSSLTPIGFMDAIEKIKAEAAVNS